MFQKIEKHRANDASNDVHRPPLPSCQPFFFSVQCTFYNVNIGNCKLYLAHLTYMLRIANAHSTLYNVPHILYRPNCAPQCHNCQSLFFSKQCTFYTLNIGYSCLHISCIVPSTLYITLYIVPTGLKQQ